MDVCNNIFSWPKASPFVYDNLTLPDEQIEYSLESSKDLGGHGGTFKLYLHEHQQYVFLKPWDEAEARHYKIITLFCKKVPEYMPCCYGTIEYNDRKYIALKDICKEGGASLKVLADIKLAGKVSNNKSHNPIANQEEMLVTRGHTKWFWDYMQMKMGAELSPGYMIAAGQWYERFVNYAYSEKNLLKALNGSSFEQLDKLKNKIDELKFSLQSDHIALIGASILLVKQESGDIEPILVDPAHMMVGEILKNNIKQNFSEEDVTKIYFPEEEKYLEQKTSNCAGFDAIIGTIDQAMNESLEQTQGT